MLTAQLTGGLGNQLFTYARLAVYAQDKGIPFQIDGSITERVLGHAPDLLDFKLMGEPIISGTEYSVVGTQIERLLWRWETIRKISGRYQDSNLGNQGVLPSNASGIKVRGFFQDYSVAREFIRIFSADPFTLKSESSTLARYISRIQTEPTLAVHMRRGDYLNYKNSFGVLSNQYYKKAIGEMAKKTEFKKIFVFTDSPALAEDFCAQISSPTEIVSAMDLSTSENLILMSKCHGLVTSNSTYSFWAAMLSSSENIITPSPWFKATDQWLNSSNLNDPQWSSCESIWMP